MTYDQEGNLLSRVLVPYSTEVIEAQPIVMSYGSEVKEEAYFYSSRVTSYGADCVGCGGGTPPASQSAPPGCVSLTAPGKTGLLTTVII